MDSKRIASVAASPDCHDEGANRPSNVLNISVTEPCEVGESENIEKVPLVSQPLNEKASPRSSLSDVIVIPQEAEVGETSRLTTVGT